MRSLEYSIQSEINEQKGVVCVLGGGGDIWGGRRALQDACDSLRGWEGIEMEWVQEGVVGDLAEKVDQKLRDLLC